MPQHVAPQSRALSDALSYPVSRKVYDTGSVSCQGRAIYYASCVCFLEEMAQQAAIMAGGVLTDRKRCSFHEPYVAYVVSVAVQKRGTRCPGTSLVDQLKTHCLEIIPLRRYSH